MNRLYRVAELLAMIDFGTADELAARLGVSKRTADRWLKPDATVRTGSADRIAMSAGFHPANVWPEWIDDALEDATPVGQLTLEGMS